MSPKTLPTLVELLDVLHESIALSTDAEIKEACELIIRAQSASSGEYEVLKAAFKYGPLHDGDVPSKTSRDSLRNDNCIAMVVSSGEEGYNACTYKGAKLYRLMKLIVGD
jgi:hypothetical protein